MPNHETKSSHVGAGLLAGAVLGVAAGLFLQSRKGKELTKDAMKKAQGLQKQVMKKLADTELLTKEKYEEVVEDVMDYYTRAKEITKAEIPAVRKYLLGRWKEIQGYLKSEE
jgi:gas vesicle protein